MIDPRLIRMVERHEGFRQKPYLDCCGKYWRECACEYRGKLTVAYGRNLDDVGVFSDEGENFILRDLTTATVAAQGAFPWFAALNDARQAVIISMTENMGIARLKGFGKMLAAVGAGDFGLAAAEMLDSEWRHEVGGRAIELAAMMRSGQYQHSATE